MDQEAGGLMAHLATYLPLLIAYSFWLPVIAGALAVAWFLPAFRTPALIVAASVVAGLVCFQFGDNTGAERIQKQWDAAVQRATEQGENARVEAERSVAADPATDRVLRSDPDNRNRP